MVIDVSSLDGSSIDASNVGVFDDGQGTVFLTGLGAIAIPEPNSAVVFLFASAFFCLKRKNR